MPFDLAESFIQAAEVALAAAFPSSYREAMLRSNGGGIVVADDDWVQYPIADTSDRRRSSRTANHLLKETAACLGWPGFPGDGLAIAGNGSGDQLVLLRRGARFEPAVYVWSHENGHLKKIADDFADLERE